MAKAQSRTQQQVEQIQENRRAESEADRMTFNPEDGYITHQGSFMTGIEIPISETEDSAPVHVGTTVVREDSIQPSVNNYVTIGLYEVI